jgi:hypothetical protein
MDPLSLKLKWESGGFYDCALPSYDSNRFEFTLPIHLAPATLHQVVVNSPFIEQPIGDARKHWPLDGFQASDHRLAGIYVWRFRTQNWPISSDTNAPKVVSVSPASGSEAAQITLVDIQFDRPMAPPEQAHPFVTVPQLETEQKPAKLLHCVQYDSAKHTFHIALALPDKAKSRFALGGFRTVGGILAQPIQLEYEVKSESFSTAQQSELNAAAKDQHLLGFLAAMKTKRIALTSLAEQVQSISMNGDRGLLTDFDSKSATFKWSKPNLFYVDATQPMLSCGIFRIGCDGQKWWSHINKELVSCPVPDMQTLNACIADPFELLSRTPAAVAVELHLASSGPLPLGGRDAAAITSWDKEDGRTRWFIDPETHLPSGVEQCSPYGVFRTCFQYTSIDQPIAAGQFAIPKVAGLTPAPPEALDSEYTNRFVNIRDGSDGSMSVRWGKFGPGGRSSSGLN